MDSIDNSLFFLVNLLFGLYGFVLMLRIISEWLGADYYNPLWQFIAKLTDKPLWLFQKLLPKRLGKLDLPAFVLLIIVELLKFVLLFIAIDKSEVIIPKGMLLVAGIMMWVVSDLIRELINLYCYMIIVFVILSWLRSRQLNPLGFILFRLIEPVLRPARRGIPSIRGIDLSPIAVFIVFQLVNYFIVVPLLQWSLQILFDWVR